MMKAPHTQATKLVTMIILTEQEYKWLHIATGKEGKKKFYNISRREALEQLNAYNRQGKGKWQYWMI